MKPFFKLPAIVLCTTSLTLFVAVSLSVHWPDRLGMEGVAQTATVSASLPASADVILKNGRTWQGEVIKIDASRQTLTIQGDSAHVISMGEIDRVNFSSTAIAYNSAGRPILRDGSGRPADSSVIWDPVAISGLQLDNQIRGIARIVLGSSVTNVDRSGQRTYVLEEIRFDPEAGTMAIKATPY